MKAAVGTVIYPGCERYVDEMATSLLSQTDSDFALLVVDDDCPRLDAFAPFGERVALRRAQALTPAGCRRELIGWAAAMAMDVLIFADADDRFSSNRIAESKRALVEHAAIANELVLFGAAIPVPIAMLAGRFNDGSEIAITDIRDANCLGMSNTAIRLAGVDGILSAKMDAVVAFDWAFFTALIAQFGPVRLTLGVETFYRQHGANIASPLDLSDAAIQRAAAVKARHYTMFSDKTAWYAEAARQFRSISARLSTEEGFRRRYCATARDRAPPRPLWWEIARTCEELGLTE
jgi:glycosyltransferase involved in cell wall biosynthesis